MSPPIIRTSRLVMARPNPRSIMVAVLVFLDLVEFAEDMGLHLGRDADAGIFHRDPQRQSRFRGRSGGGDGDADMAALGELHRVSDQVEQDLPQTPAIAHQPVRPWHVDIELEGKVPALQPRGGAA